MEIFRSVEQNHHSLKQIIKDHTDLTERLIDLCNKTVPDRAAVCPQTKQYSLECVFYICVHSSKQTNVCMLYVFF